MSMNQKELADMNIKLPQAMEYIVQSCARLLLEVDTLTYERDEYQRKFQNEADLRNREKLLKPTIEE